MIINISKLKWTFMASIVCLAISSCADDDNSGITNPIRGSIVGEWFNDQSKGSEKLFAVGHYYDDGAYDKCFVWINKDQNSYDYSNGTYSFINSIYTENINNASTSFDVQYMDGYSLIISNSDLGAFEKFNRIVDTYDMVVGEERLYVIEDIDFIPTEYVSTDPSIATVDDAGIIHAVKQGMTFIKATSSLGTAVICINVTDPNNIIDDFASYIGASIDDIKNIYGTNYIDLYNGTAAERNYNIYDKYVEHAVFMYFARTIFNISINLREYADWDAILSSYRSKYDKDENNDQVFTTTIRGKKVKINVMPFDNTISFSEITDQQVPDNDDFHASDKSYQQFDDIMNMPVAQAANILGVEMTDEVFNNRSFSVNIDDNEIFERIHVIFDTMEEPYNVYCITMYGKRGISRENIEPWYKEHYKATGDELSPYYSEEGDFYIQFDERISRVDVTYSKYQ